MAATPPLQIVGSPQTPLTPLHGAAYDHEDSPRRTSARLRQKRVLEDAATHPSTKQTRVSKTPTSPRNSQFGPHSPARTPQRKSTTRRVQIMSPTSPESDASASKPTTSRSTNANQLLSTGTTLGEGMLPTPIKTPNKKHKMVNKSNPAARILFEDPATTDELIASPRRNRKNKRYNGFSLESFRAEDGGSGIQIFTDSRDQIPQVNNDEDNPFVEQDRRGASAKKVAGTAKRRKVSQSKKLDPQVERALRDDEGMVYVFRGKKVYRRFDDTGEEEEAIDSDDLGLLAHANDGSEIVKPLKTLTRKAIKPTRLFQSEEQKRAREVEKEEEAMTEIDETAPGPSTIETKGRKRVQGDRTNKASRDNDTQVPANPISTEMASGRAGGKNGSPFDSWPRVKPGSASSSSAPRPTRGRKRAASPGFEEQPSLKT